MEWVTVGMPWRQTLGSLYPSSGSGEQDREVPDCCFLFLEIRPPHSWAGHGGWVSVLLSQVECLETGSGKFLQTNVKTIKPCERLQTSTKEPESTSCRRGSKISNFCLGSRKHSEGKEVFPVCFNAVQGGGILLDHTAFRVIFLWWKNSHSK